MDTEPEVETDCEDVAVLLVEDDVILVDRVPVFVLLVVLTLVFSEVETVAKLPESDATDENVGVSGLLVLVMTTEPVLVRVHKEAVVVVWPLHSGRLLQNGPLQLCLQQVNGQVISSPSLRVFLRGLASTKHR